MPARRDLYTGRFEFLERGWGPLEDTDLDLPRQISGTPNSSLSLPGIRVSQLVTDHFHLWEQGSGNYHMGYSGFEFVRGIEADNWATDPIEFPLPAEQYRLTKFERHFRNAEIQRRQADHSIDERQWFAPRTFGAAVDWLRRNHTRQNFYLHIDSFPPHEPWDPPERLVRQFDSRGYELDEYFPCPAYASIEHSGLREDQVRHVQALYSASVVHVDQCLGMLIDALDHFNLWETTLVILTTDHGTYNGSRGLLGKMQTHLWDPICHIPLIVSHPVYGHGQRRSQLVQLVDLYTTTLMALDCPVPSGVHGIDLLPILEDPGAISREVAISGVFGESVSITDGRYVLHQDPVATNAPLYWYGMQTPRFLHYDLGPVELADDGRVRRQVHHEPRNRSKSWVSDLASDPHETTNLLDSHEEVTRRLRRQLGEALIHLAAPAEQCHRLGLEA